MEDPVAIQAFITTGETYQFRLLVIKGFVFVSAVVLIVTVLAILAEDFFDKR